MCERTIVSDLYPDGGEYAAIEKKIEDMIAYIHIVLRQFPKEEKYVLSARIRCYCYDIYELAIMTNKKIHKKTTVTEFNIKHELLRRMIHIAYKLRYIDVHKFRVAQKHISEVGRMLGAWIKQMNG